MSQAVTSSTRCSFCGKGFDRCAGHRIGIVGSRDFPDLSLVRQLVAKVPDKWVVVSGGARGVDHAAEQWALRNGLKVEVIRPDWERFGRSAGFRRNEDLVEAIDCLVAFWTGTSKGTEHTIELAKKHLGDKRVRVITQAPAQADPATQQRNAKRAKAESLRHNSDITVTTPSGARYVARNDDYRDMQREWAATKAAWTEAAVDEGSYASADILDPEVEIKRSKWDDQLHPIHSGLYQGEYDPNGRWLPARWDDGLELDDMVANWEELSSEQLQIIDTVMGSQASDIAFWRRVFGECIQQHRPVTERMLAMAEAALLDDAIRAAA